MENYKNILIIGTSHIARQSIIEINKKFLEFNPEIVCVELDKKRLQALLTNAKPDYSISGIKKYGLQGYLFAVIAGILQRKLGNVVGVKPGSDMLTAINLAKQNNKQLVLIDQDIDITLRRFSKEFTFKEKFKLLFDILKSPFSKKKIKVNLNEVPEENIINEMTTQLRERYPSLYKVLIYERNIVMAKNIVKIMERNPEKKIFVVIGAGHEKEMVALIKREENKRDKIY
ncbi:MAG: TraB/GumN family protein [Candidatus Woesearchaeota archaeon]